VNASVNAAGEAISTTAEGVQAATESAFDATKTSMDSAGHAVEAVAEDAQKAATDAVDAVKKPE